MVAQWLSRLPRSKNNGFEFFLIAFMDTKIYENYSNLQISITAKIPIRTDAIPQIPTSLMLNIIEILTDLILILETFLNPKSYLLHDLDDLLNILACPLWLLIFFNTNLCQNVIPGPVT